MDAPTDVAPLALHGRRIGERPQGIARALSRATMASMVGAFALSFAVTALFSSLVPWVEMLLGLMYLATMGVAALAAVAQLWCWITPKSTGSLAVDARGVHVARALGRRDIARDRVEAGWLVHDAEGAEVELRLRNGDELSVSVASPEEAEAVLDAVGVDPSKRALSMQMGGPELNVALAMGSLVPGSCVASLIAVTLGGIVALPSASMGFLIFTLAALSVPLSLRAFGPPRVQVGRDGVSVRRGFRAWFASFEEISHVSMRGYSLVLHLRDGSERVISGFGTRASRRQALGDRIAAGVLEAHAPRDLSARLTALDRNGRTIEEWRAALREVLTEREAYRSTGLTRDEVVAALEDPHATPDRRIGAAYALSFADKEQAGQRVRVAVETIAHEPVRVALTRAADGALDEESVTAATATQVRVV